MNAIIVTTHGNFSEGILNSLEMITGKAPNIYVLGLKGNIEEYRNSLETMISKLKKEYKKLLIISDMKGGTPYNESMRYHLTNPESIQIVTGVNLPMLVEISYQLQSLSLEELQSLALESGRQSIIS